MLKIKSVFKFGVVALLLSFTLQNLATTKVVDLAKQKTDDPLILSELTPKSIHHQASRYIAKFINDYHYIRPKLNDQQSAAILDKYIEILDSNKSYFLAKDIESFQQYRLGLDNSILTGWLKPSYHIYSVFQKRWAQRNQFAMSLLAKEIKFTSDEYFYYDREDATWAKTAEELDILWRQRVKSDALNLILADKTWEESKEILGKRYKAALRRVSQINSEDVFSYFMNAYTNTVDPHTSYFSPRSAENFDIDMKLSLEGIGAVLQSDEVYTKVNRIVEAGPADKSGELSVDDKIIAVGQGDEPLVDVVGWRLDDVVDLIRGKAGSKVRLEIEPKNSSVSGKTKVISIIREKVKLEEQAAQSEIIEIEQQGKIKRIGVIDLPKFYVDFQAKYEGKEEYRSTTRDIKNLIIEMKKDKGIDALIIDLRANGGGALTEATSLTGLFIDQGPVVQDKNRRGQVDILRDTDSGVVWDGAMAVLVNATSASASEIFAGAIQDYGRGLIIGEQTFGKGTVQRILDLNRHLRTDDNKFGALKLTINKFYRITGESTQNKGVVPDILFPDPYARDEFGEQSYDSALEWDVIQAVEFDKVSDLFSYIEPLNKRHLSRMQTNREFQYMIKDIEVLNQRREEKKISLNIKQRKVKLEEDKQKDLLRENERRLAQGKKVIKLIDDDTELTETDDVKLYAAANVLIDFKRLQDIDKLAQLSKRQ